jgi:hypothetical protein
MAIDRNKLRKAAEEAHDEAWEMWQHGTFDNPEGTYVAAVRPKAIISLLNELESIQLELSQLIQSLEEANKDAAFFV